MITKNHRKIQYPNQSEFESRVVELTNQSEKEDPAKLEIDLILGDVAKIKSLDMQTYNYFDHNSP